MGTMPRLIGAALLASTLASMAFGQIAASVEALGVLIGACLLMTLQQE
jgi:hypothetical protein